MSEDDWDDVLHYLGKALEHCSDTDISFSIECLISDVEEKLS